MKNKVLENGVLGSLGLECVHLKPGDVDRFYYFDFSKYCYRLWKRPMVGDMKEWHRVYKMSFRRYGQYNRGVPMSKFVEHNGKMQKLNSKNGRALRLQNFGRFKPKFGFPEVEEVEEVVEEVLIVEHKYNFYDAIRDCKEAISENKVDSFVQFVSKFDLSVRREFMTKYEDYIEDNFPLCRIMSDEQYSLIDDDFKFFRNLLCVDESHKQIDYCYKCHESGFVCEDWFNRLERVKCDRCVAKKASLNQGSDRT